MVYLLGSIGLVWLVLATLTASGARRRGTRWAAAAALGVVFPATWVAWYVRDEHPFEHGIWADVPPRSRHRPA